MVWSFFPPKDQLTVDGSKKKIETINCEPVLLPVNQRMLLPRQVCKILLIIYAGPTYNLLLDAEILRFPVFPGMRQFSPGVSGLPCEDCR